MTSRSSSRHPPRLWRILIRRRQSRRGPPGGAVAWLIAISLLAGCAPAPVGPSDPGPPSNWSGRLTCAGLTTAECNAAAKALVDALEAARADLPPPIAIEIGPDAACLGQLIGNPELDCAYALLPGQRLLGHAIVDFADGAPKGYSNLRVGSDGEVTADPVSLAIR